VSRSDSWTVPSLRADLARHLVRGIGIRIGSHVDLVWPQFPGMITLTNETVHHRLYPMVFRARSPGKLSRVRITRVRGAVYLNRRPVIDAAGDGRDGRPCYRYAGCLSDIRSE